MWGAIIQLIAGLGTAGYNAYKANKTKKELKDLGDVDYTIPQGYADNVGVTANELAQGGIDAETLNAILGQFQQQFSSSTNATLQAGGGVNDIAKLYGTFNDSVEKLGVQSSLLRNQKLENYLQSVSTYAGQEALKWKLNQYDRNRNDKAAASAALQGFNQGTNSGVNMAVQGGVNLGNYLNSPSVNTNQSQYNDMVKKAFASETDPVFYNNNFGNPPLASTQYANQNQANNAIDIGGMNNVNQMWNF